MRYCKQLLILTIIALVLAVPPIWPYGYYEFLRLLVSVVAAICAYQAYHDAKSWFVLLLLVLLLFNPIAPVHLEKGIWAVIDIATALLFVAYIRRSNIPA